MTATDQAKPPYQRIAEDLRAKIERGDPPPGQQLPSIRALAEAYGSGTMTIQRALAVLRDDGVIATTRGYGNFVRVAGDEPVTPASIADSIAAMEADIRRLSQTLASLKRQVQSEGKS